MAKNRHFSFDFLNPIIVLFQIHHFYGNKRSCVIVNSDLIIEVRHKKDDTL
jgi:hypothetical protein